LNQHGAPVSRTTGGRSDENRTVSMLRTMLLAIFLLGSVGSGVELLLLNHLESLLQWIPLVLILLSFCVLSWHAIRGNTASTRAVQGTMVAFIAAGLAGVYFHHQGSVEFKLESNPSMAGWQLFWQAIRSKTPPALAPGVMIQLGLIGLAYTYRHPALFTSTEIELDKGE
jgi:cation transport ATPase